ncbi:hypothetical protein EGW08_014815 [Elysia chlorotica]|uniref:Uncharacterized protein n=1 Tax=Elysia chlorotica TaxID=188477 RepID=A0A433T779_ELYCH|nr:hypothetical protein EGW08_014815 [Elysia chlorotica]
MGYIVHGPKDCAAHTRQGKDNQSYTNPHRTSVFGPVHNIVYTVLLLDVKPTQPTAYCEDGVEDDEPDCGRAGGAAARVLPITHGAVSWGIHTRSLRLRHRGKKEGAEGERSGGKVEGGGGQRSGGKGEGGGGQRSGGKGEAGGVGWGRGVVEKEKEEGDRGVVEKEKEEGDRGVVEKEEERKGEREAGREEECKDEEKGKKVESK